MKPGRWGTGPVKWDATVCWEKLVPGQRDDRERNRIVRLACSTNTAIAASTNASRCAPIHHWGGLILGLHGSHLVPPWSMA